MCNIAQHTGMRKKIIRIALWVFGIFLVLFILFATILYLNREELKKAVLTEVNEVLAEPVAVKKVSVSLRRFPYASILFDEVYSRGAGGTEKDTLLYAQKVYFEFNLWNVFSQNLSIHRISLENGTAHILRPEGQIPNYQIWKEDTTSSSSNFTLNEVSFQNFKLYQYEGAIDQWAAGHVNQLKFSGDFEAGGFFIENQGDLYIDSLKVDTTIFLKAIPAKVSFLLKGDTLKSEISKGVLNLDGITTDVALNMEPAGVALIASQKGTDLKKLQKLATVQRWMPALEMELAGSSDLDFKGVFEEDEDPKVDVNFTTRNATLRGYESAKIESFDCSGSYHLSDNRDRIRLISFAGKGRTGEFEGSLDINDLSRPGVVLDLKSNLELSEWLIFFPLDTITKPEGRAAVDLHFENKFESLKKIKPEELRRAKASGTFVLSDMGFTFKNSEKRISDLRADLKFLGNDLKVGSFYFRTGQSDIYLEGVFRNVLNFAYFKNQKLKVDTRVRAQKVVMEDFLVSSPGGSEEDYSLEFARSLDLELDLKVDQFLFDHFYATEISGMLLVKNGVINARAISLKADEGSFKGNLSINTQTNPYSLEADLSAHSVNIHDLFVSFNNFGQDAIAAENLYGRAAFDLKLNCRMSPGLDIDLPSIAMTSELIIQNGNLKNYEPMLALSRFADLKELQDVRFSKLQNNISINNSQVIIPMMNINSNVMDMGLQGQHGFDNVIDYSIRLKLSDVLFNNRKSEKKKSEFDDHLIVVERDDDPNIYVKMIGPALDPEISLDRKGIGQSINRDLKKQGQELKNIFKKDDPKEEKKKDSGIEFDLFGEDKDGKS